jgi:hypothetical protein
MKSLLFILACLFAGTAFATPAYDTTSGHSGSTLASGSSPTSVTVTMVAGETGFCFVTLDIFSSYQIVTSISGGGTWGFIEGYYVSSSSYIEVWATAAGGATAATSISVTTGVSSSTSVFVFQYTGVGQINQANGVTLNNSSTSTPSLVLNTLQSGSVALAMFYGLAGDGTITATTGTLRKNFNTGSLIVADNTSATNTLNATGGATSVTMLGIELNAAATTTPTYDAVSADSACAFETLSQTSFSITVTMVAGETGVISVLSYTISGSPNDVTSISGGGTWTLAVRKTVGTAELEVWTTPAGGVTTALSVTVTKTTASNEIAEGCARQYISVGSVTANTNAIETDTGSAVPNATSVSLTTTGTGAIVDTSLGMPTLAGSPAVSNSIYPLKGNYIGYSGSGTNCSPGGNACAVYIYWGNMPTPYTTNAETTSWGISTGSASAYFGIALELDYSSSAIPMRMLTHFGL